MKKTKITSLLAANFVLFASSSFALTTFTGVPNADIAVGTNWSNGLPTSSGNVGTLSSLAEWYPANPTLTNYYLDIVGGGELTRTNFFNPQTIDGGVWTVNGGSITNAVQLTLVNAATFILNTGSVQTGSGRDLIANGSVFTMAGGNLTVGDEFSTTSAGGTINLDGGTANVGKMGTGFNNVGTYNFGGANVTTSLWGNFEKTGARTLNFEAASGTFDITGDFDARTTTMDWTSGSDYTLTVTGSLLDSGAATTFETLYNDGRLLLDGSNAAPFASVFNVSGGTLTLAIPEPTSTALSGLAGLVALLRRRR